MQKKIILITILCSLFLSYSSKVKNEQQPTIVNDSISKWITSSKNQSYTLKKRISFLYKAKGELESNPSDSSTCKNLSTIANQFLKLDDTINYKKTNRLAINMALEVKDTFTLADTHWNSANFHKKKEVYDSAFYHYNQAYKYFESINENEDAAKMLYGMSFIKGRFRDYTGSEILIIKAISKWKLLKINKSLYSSYNHLALLQKDIEEYDKALFYHNKSLNYIDLLENKKELYEISLNNIGLVYLKKGNYEKAINYFDRVLRNDSLKITNIKHYARAIDNRAYAKLINNDTLNVKKDFFKSLYIRDSLNNKAGVVIVKIHLAEYFLICHQQAIALQYASEANTLSKEIKNTRDYLKSLQLLAKLDKKNAAEHLEKYINYDDSLRRIERKIQNKFTRIAFETDEYIDETKRLSQQTKRLSEQKIFISITAISILFILVLLYFIKDQKTKNEKLELETEQQKANEQIYILTLKQQAKLEEEKTKERNRISKELHDGVLGKLFGTRIGLGFLDFGGNEQTKKQYLSFLQELQIIEKDIRDVSHKLNNNFRSSDINFKTVLHQLLENKSKIGLFSYKIETNENIVWEHINEIIKVNLYRILQEALQNIIKHAQSKHITLTCSIEAENLLIIIVDDGLGFSKKKNKKGIGIKNIKSRIDKLNGTLTIISFPEKGTSIKIKIPLK